MKPAFVPVALLVLFASVAQADTVPATPCVRWWSQVWARMPGYDHVVFIENSCAAPVDCVVRTDISPEAVRARVPTKEQIDVTTFRGSPSRAFTAQVACTMTVPRPVKPRDAE